MSRRTVADQLVDVEQNRPIVVHVRLDVQDNARVFVIDRVDDGVVGAEHGRAAGRYRNLITHLERCIAVVDDHKRRIGKDLDVGYRRKRVDDDARGRGVAGDDIESARQARPRGGREPVFEAALLMRLGICPAAVLEIAPPWRKNCTP